MSEFYAYIATKKGCGCIIGAGVDDEKDWIARDVADWIRRGYFVERVKVSDEKPLAIKRCNHGEKE